MESQGNMKTFIEWVIENSKKKIALFDDYFCSTIDVKSLANFILDLLNTNFKGIINIGSSSISNKKKFAEKFIKKLGIKNIKIEKKV